MEKETMYAKKEKDGSWTLRQARYKGRNHPHDVCAVARTLEELKEMTRPYWPDAKFPDDKGKDD